MFDDAFVPDDHVMGEIDGAWKQATSELAYERSGPERFLDTFYVLPELIRALGPEPDLRGAEGLGRLVAQLAHPAAHVGVGRRYAASRQGAGGRGLDRQGSRHRLGAEIARRVRELAAFLKPEMLNRAALEDQLALRHHDRAQAHHSGRHH